MLRLEGDHEYNAWAAAKHAFRAEVSEAFPEGYLMDVDDPGNVAAPAASSHGHLCYGVSDCSL
jgi:hypothetical protein